MHNIFIIYPHHVMQKSMERGSCNIKMTNRKIIISQFKFAYPLESILLTWINFNHRMYINNHMPSKMWDEITYPFANFNGATVEVWEWINNYILHFMKDVVTYLYWDWK